MVTSRRRFLGVVSAAGSVGLAGCRLLDGDRSERNEPYGSSQELPTTADWPGFRHDGFNSGAIADGGTPLKERPAVTWRQPVTGVEGSSRHPVVADDLVVFPDWDPAPRPNGVENRVLRAFDAASGKEQWKVPVLSPGEDQAHLSRPTVTADSHIVVGVTDRQTGREESALRAYTMNGKLVWETEGVRGDVTYDGRNDVLYAPTTDEAVARVDAATGTIDWTRQLFGRIGPMAVSSDKLYVVAGAGGSVYALAPSDGRGVWRTDLNSRIVTPPTVEYHVHIVDNHGTWYALDRQSGEIAWRLPLHGSSPIAVGPYHGYVATGYGHSVHLSAVDLEKGRLR